MPRFRLPAVVVFLLLGVVACGSVGRKADPMMARETFDSDNTYSRSYASSPENVCEAARRALMSQGYVVQRADGLVVEGNKNFQPANDVHEQVQLRVSCVPQANGQSWAFASALQDRYNLKKSNNSASLGLPVGSVSLPFGSSDDSLVKVASRTVQDGTFYKYFFALIQRYLPPPGEAKVVAAPAPPPAPEVKVVPAQEPAQEPALQPPPIEDAASSDPGEPVPKPADSGAPTP